ncbi:TlpA family protein disulfide reductase [Chitinophaga pendula]|uniref:peroxiredoxin family protein n=1 Tax=Chitinophaga TaxID=79328 RepID=UPI0018DEFEF8|nr:MULTISPECIES: TlpA disulfide reductase family protein [Chitinophaga]UCJ06610.1 TlpA family protein disulfide reductase [Chitinophaga pendula]
MQKIPACLLATIIACGIACEAPVKNAPAQDSPAQAPQGEGLLPGATAPDFSMPDVNGKQVSLSSLRGQYVLLDFWASWCPNCRREHPNVINLYNKYKNKNFTVLGVSLDEHKEKWLQAIARDRLPWTQVSNLQGWTGRIQQDIYQLNVLPTNFLLDPAGRIIARDLRGDILDIQLAALLN